MIRLCYSNRTEALCEALAENLGEGRSTFLDPVHLVVPNPLVESYVKQALARRLGIAAHIETQFLRGFLRQVATASAPEILIVDRDLMEGELLALLADPRRLQSRDLGPVRAYLPDAPDAPDAPDVPDAEGATGEVGQVGKVGEDGDDGWNDRKRVQLAAQMAALFDEYAFSRPEMLASWRQGGLVADLDEPLQRWQRELWLALFGRGGVFAARHGMTLPDFFAQVPPESLRPPPAAHVFGISYVARLYRSIFGSIARATALFVYTLNPCREYWEDLAPRRRGAPPADPRRFPRRRGGAQLTLGGLEGSAPTGEDALENPLLALWGRPGRDNMRLLNQLADCDFDARFVDPTAGVERPSLLATLHKEVLDREPAAARATAENGSAPDASVQIFPAPDPRRELEIVAAEIWSRVRTDATLTFAEVAVIVPPAAAPAYLPLARAVFDEASALPHTIVDLPRPAESRILDAVTRLLELPNGPLGRPDLLGLAMHPTVARRFPEVDPDAWLVLCEALEIVRGADRADHADSYLDRDRLSWDLGLRRLALGAFLSGRRSGERRPFVLPGESPVEGEPLLAADLPSALEPAARALGIIARELVAYARAAAARPATFATFASLLRRTIASTIRPADADEEAALGDAFSAIERVAALVPPALEISFRVAAELVKARLGAGRGHHRSPEGVTIASFVPMRALPFRIVFVVGLDERVFPASEALDALDLRAGARQAGDVTPREQDEYMFLETLLSARERLYLSYVARDPVTGEHKNPSSTLLALGEVLPAGLERPLAPLSRHLDDAACAVLPAAARERQAAALSRSLRRAAGGIVQLPALPALRTMLAPEAWAPVGERLDWVGAPETATATATVRRALTLADLRRFLECPLQASARVLLPLHDDDDAADDAEAALREHERLDESRLRTIPFLREVLVGAPAEASLADAYDRAAALAVLDGTLPSGLFGRALRERHLVLLTCWRDGLLQATDGASPRLSVLWLGAAPEHRSDLAPLPALDLPLSGGATILVGGRTELCGETPTGGRMVISLFASTGRDSVERDLLRPFFTHLALSAMEAGDGPTRAILIRPNDDGSPHLDERLFPAVTAGQARAYLGALAAELLAQVHATFLPCEAIFSWRKRRDKGDPIGIRDMVLLLRDDNWTHFLSDRGPIPDPRAYPVPSEEIAAAIVERRFGPYFGALVTELAKTTDDAPAPPKGRRR